MVLEILQALLVRYIVGEELLQCRGMCECVRACRERREHEWKRKKRKCDMSVARVDRIVVFVKTLHFPSSLSLS